MPTLDAPVFDADNHYYEALDAFTRAQKGSNSSAAGESGPAAVIGAAARSTTVRAS